jgi:hypothetical protein
MSLITIEHTFCAWCEKEWASFYKEAPKLEAIADTTLKYVTGALQIAASLETGNPEIAVISKVLTTAQNGVTAASGLINDFGATPTAASMLSAVSSDLSGLLTAAHVTNAKSVAAVTKAVTETNALVGAVNAASAVAK